MAVETLTLEDLGGGRTRLVTTTLFHTREERDGMLGSGMDAGVQGAYVALDRVLAAPPGVGPRRMNAGGPSPAPRTKARVRGGGAEGGPTVTPFLMFRDRLDEALALYTSLFADGRVVRRGRSGKDGPLIAAEFEIGGQRFLAYEGGPYFAFSEGLSLHVHCADQAAVDALWAGFLSAGSKPTQCGWLTDPFGLSWQIIPRRLTELLSSADPRKVKAVVAAMLPMRKLDLAALERAGAST